MALGIFATAALSLYSQNKAKRETARANRIAARIEALQSHKSQVEALRQQRIARAEVVAQAASSGTSSSSPVQGALGALASQGAANQSYATALDILQQSRMRLLDKAGTSMTRVGVADTVGRLIGG